MHPTGVSKVAKPARPRDFSNLRYYTVTGEQADEATIEQTDESESFLQKANQGQNVDIHQERHHAVNEIEKNLLELHKRFLDMATAQGEQMNNIELKVTFDVGQLRKNQRSSRKWTCIAIIILLIIIAIIVVPIVTKNF